MEFWLNSCWVCIKKIHRDSLIVAKFYTDSFTRIFFLALFLIHSLSTHLVRAILRPFSLLSSRASNVSVESVSWFMNVASKVRRMKKGKSGRKNYHTICVVSFPAPWLLINALWETSSQDLLSEEKFWLERDSFKVCDKLSYSEGSFWISAPMFGLFQGDRVKITMGLNKSHSGRKGERESSESPNPKLESLSLRRGKRIEVLSPNWKEEG